MIPTSGLRRRNLVQDRRAGEVALGAGARGQAQALERLGAAVLRVDEIALEVRRQHARAAGRPGVVPPDRAEHRPERLRRAGHRRRAERRHAVARQPRRDARDRVVTVERVGPFDAVDVDVDEAGHDRVLVQIEVEIARRPRRSVPQHVDDAIAVEDDGRRAQQAIGQHDVGAQREQSHRLGWRHAVPVELAALERQRRARLRRGTACDPTSRSSLRSQRSSGAENTITPALSAGGNRRSSM